MELNEAPYDDTVEAESEHVSHLTQKSSTTRKMREEAF